MVMTVHSVLSIRGIIARARPTNLKGDKTASAIMTSKPVTIAMRSGVLLPFTFIVAVAGAVPWR
jgi:hypothetical protein